MKLMTPLAILALALIFGGCANEAWYADREFGVASRDAFDQQIAHKDYKYAGMPVEGMDGLYSENIMGRYLDTYKEGFTKETFEISETGIQD
jgi:hypothetical protein